MTEADNAAPVQTDNAAPDTTSRMDLGQPETQLAAPANDFKIPDAYKEKGWAKNVKSVDDLFKIHDDAQALIGKKKIVPDFDNATEQEIESYFDQLRPKDGYDGLFPDGTDDGKKKTLGELLQKSGLSKVQAKRLVEGYSAMEQETVQKMFDKDDFLNTLKESFGGNFEKQAGETAVLIKKNLNDADRAALDEVPNKYLGLIYRLANNLNQAYGASESGILGEGKTPSVVDVSAQKKDVRAQLEALGKRPHTAEEKQALVDQLDKLYQKEARK